MTTTAALVVVAAAVLAGLLMLSMQRKPKRSNKHTVAFFHPFCDAGGGGERVLWTAVEAVVRRSKKSVAVVVYTWDQAGTSQRILDAVKTQFNIDINEADVQFVHIKSWKWLLPKSYPHLTLIFQSLGAIFTGWECLRIHPVPEIFIDTVGFAFVLPLAKLFGVHTTISYVHYPTISTDMLDVVANRKTAHNNHGWIARYWWASWAKLVYYRTFAWMYGWAGSYSDIVMVNSSWTLGHINAIWCVPDRTLVVFPPCDTHALAQLPLDATITTKPQSKKDKTNNRGRSRTIISVAQFRPEKNHALQIESFATLLKKHPEYASQKSLLKSKENDSGQRVSLVLAGSVRNADDAERVAQLRAQITKLGLEDSVTIMENLPYEKLRDMLSTSMIGLHTMWNEHFGISIIEYMAAGVIPVAHCSGGPLMDIVVPFRDQPTGFLATTQDEYASKLHEVLSMSDDERRAMQQAARQSVIDRFSADAFVNGFMKCIDRALK